MKRASQSYIKISPWLIKPVMFPMYLEEIIIRQLFVVENLSSQTWNTAIVLLRSPTNLMEQTYVTFLLKSTSRFRARFHELCPM